jgi:hypothetical protein
MKKLRVEMRKDYCFFSRFSGTGSKPPLCQGLHFIILRAVRMIPFRTPCDLNASIPYWEHEG